MGTGKTKTAKALAGKLNMEYVSTDELIEKKENRPISDIFKKEGEGYFRKIEKEIVKNVSSMKNVVVDAGGGVCIDPDNVSSLKKNGVMICLWAEPEVILERTKKYLNRPLLNTEDPLRKISELLNYRKPFYERADHHIRNSDMSVEKVVSEIERIIKDVPMG